LEPGEGGAQAPPNRGEAPKFTRTSDTLLLTDSQKKIVNMMLPDVGLRLKCIKFDFSWGCVLDSARGPYSTPPDPLAVLKGPTSNGTEGEEGNGKREWMET